MSDIDELKSFVGDEQAPQGVAPAGQSDQDLLQNFVEPEMEQERYGTLGQQALTFVEAAARAASLGTSDFAENEAGVSSEARLARMRVNPGTNFAGNVTGLVGLGAATAGLGEVPAVLGETGNVISPALSGGLRNVVARTAGGGLGGAALGGATEGAAIGTGSVISDKALGDPDLNAQKIAATIGGQALLGGVLGLGGEYAGQKFSGWMNKNAPIPQAVQDEINTANKAGEFENAQYDNGLRKDAHEIVRAATEEGLPIGESMVSDNRLLQAGESSLMQGAPTIPKILRNRMWTNAFNAVTDKIKGIVPMPDMSMAEAGQSLRNGIVNKIQDLYAPVRNIYDFIDEVAPTVPLSEGTTEQLAKDFMDNEHVKLFPDSPQTRFAESMGNNVQVAQTAADLGVQKGGVRGMAQSTIPAEQRVAASIADKINTAQEDAVIKHAEDLQKFLDGARPQMQELYKPMMDKLNQLVPAMRAAREAYKPFIEKVARLSKELGDAKIYGPEDAMSYIKNMPVEKIVSRLSGKGNSQFRAWFTAEFPEEAAILREYEKNVLKNKATVNGDLDPNKFLKLIDRNHMEPEIKKYLFSPDEIKRLDNLGKYMNRFPKNFNPSGTAAAGGFRRFFSSPVGAAAENLTDFGILAYIKAAGKLPPEMQTNMSELGMSMAQKYNHMNAVRALTYKTNEEIHDQIHDIMSSRPK